MKRLISPNILGRLALIVLAAYLSACSANSKLSGGFGDSSLFDFEMSSLNVTTDYVPADGVASVVVVITLRNSKNVPVPNFQPTYTATGAGNTLIPCTLSDASGISVCLVKSTVIGQKTFSVSNIHKLLEGPINFRSPQQQKPGFGIASAFTLKQNGRDGSNNVIAVGVTSIAEPIGPFVLDDVGASTTTRAKTNFPGILNN